jgi:hypothetical protein
LIVANGVIDRQIQLQKKPVQGDPDVVGVVITVTDEGKGSRPFVIGEDSPALFPRIQENSPRREHSNTF